ncbi:MAG: c-type cytochrome [Methylotetracoccus sp.]|nr:c-type cytochrome [Methylotetracoccus sp.]
MKQPLILALSTGLAVASVNVNANEQLAQSKNCLACHGIEQKIVGPAYKDVANKYAGQPDVADKLAEKVVKGGGGVWGQMPMPPNPQVSAEEAKQLVQWILSLR